MLEERGRGSGKQKGRMRSSQNRHSDVRFSPQPAAASASRLVSVTPSFRAAIPSSFRQRGGTERTQRRKGKMQRDAETNGTERKREREKAERSNEKDKKKRETKEHHAKENKYEALTLNFQRR